MKSSRKHNDPQKWSTGKPTLKKKKKHRRLKQIDCRHEKTYAFRQGVYAVQCCLRCRLWVSRTKIRGLSSLSIPKAQDLQRSATRHDLPRNRARLLDILHLTEKHDSGTPNKTTKLPIVHYEPYAEDLSIPNRHGFRSKVRHA